MVCFARSEKKPITMTFVFVVDLMQQKSTNDSPRNVCSFSIDEVSEANLPEKDQSLFFRLIVVHATGTQSVI